MFGLQKTFFRRRQRGIFEKKEDSVTKKRNSTRIEETQRKEEPADGREEEADEEEEVGQEMNRNSRNSEKSTWFGSVSFASNHVNLDVFSPTSSELLEFNDAIDDVACTHLHVAILMSNGKKLGIRRIDDYRREFRILELPESESSFLLTTSKAIYVVRMKNEKTSEILKILENSEDVEIRNIDFPWPVKIMEARGGHDFCIFRDSAGNLFSMGTGTRGELGVGLIRRLDEPVHIEHLAGIQISKFACGGWHTVALSNGGDVYVWGWNRYGSLGQNQSSTEMYPTLLDPSEDVDQSLSPDENIDDVAATEYSTRITVGSAHFSIGSDNEKINDFEL
ncbi:Protein CBG15383 [Caenorhabditis briggsae]|uniref:Protein CBG15383 n=1 Tax=Caenorhabditis briggsae TaxID=6238 RepID=A8XM27_CAEBR|nr:Protein CBG15383 [Caenorhabditis briggsae]CAP33702.2 Protein CBG15383 [Caenorhabditis briggsae]